MDLIQLPQEKLLKVVQQTASKKGMTLQSIEKDLWVTMLLRVVSNLPYAEAISFKGGTSLSKCWHLINRFSEDVDLAIDRKILGFEGELSMTQIRGKLRKAAKDFVKNQMQDDIASGLTNMDIKIGWELRFEDSNDQTKDPNSIYIDYCSLFPHLSYIQNSVKLEIGGRSMSSAIAKTPICSIAKEIYPTLGKFESPINIFAVLPERTFLEKVFLLHEEFSKPIEKVRTERMSRHLYDIVQILKTPIGEKAISDKGLYGKIVNHRQRLTRVSGVDYGAMLKGELAILPPKEIEPLWRTDYIQMCRSMIYSNPPSFDELLAELQRLQEKLRKIHQSPTF